MSTFCILAVILKSGKKIECEGDFHSKDHYISCFDLRGEAVMGGVNQELTKKQTGRPTPIELHVHV